MREKAIACTLVTILGAIAGLHGYWALGGLWPGHDVQSLINTVIGDSRVTQMPAPWMTWSVVVALGVAAALALLAAGVWRVGPRWLTKLGVGVVTSVFFLRGAVGVAAGLGLFDTNLTEPFATLDLRLYSPLCVFLAIGFGMLFLRTPGAAEHTRA